VSSLLALWRMLDPAQKRRAIGMQVLAIAMAFSTLFGIAALAPFLLVLADPRTVEQYAPLAWLHARVGLVDPHAFAMLLGAGFIVAVTLANAVNLLGALATSRFALRIGDDLHEALMNEYLHRDYRFHARAGATDLFGRVIFSVDRVAHGVLVSGMTFITQSVLIAVVVGSVLLLDAPMAVGALAWLGGGYLLLYAVARRRLQRLGDEQKLLIARRSHVAKEALDAVKEVLLYGRQTYFREAFAAACRRMTDIAQRTQAMTLTPRHAIESITVCGLVAAASLLSSHQVLGAWLTQLTFLCFAAYRLLPAAQQMYAALVRIRAHRAVFEQIAGELAVAMRRRVQPSAPSEEQPAWQPRESIVLEAIHFSYEGATRAALDDVSLQVRAGSMVGLAGANGSGKTTLIDILLGLLEPDSGQVRVDGVGIHGGNRAAWQRALAYIPQTVSLIDGTVAENVAFGARVDPARLAEVVRLARLDAFVDSLPAGLDERLGAGARSLSGGERQRVGIARALYRDAPVLVLDEPTSSLDGAAERDLLQVLRGLHGTRTVVIVAHSLHTLRDCDRIFELEGGHLVRSGSPAELARLSPVFRVADMT
jgi:HlyD family secretion protein